MEQAQKVVFSVDDDESVRDAIALALIDSSFVVKTFGEGKSAVEAVQEGRPDLVLLDLNMPEMDGVEVMHKLNEIDPDIPVYIVTAFADEYMARLRDARENGLRFQIASKPLTGDQIRLIVQGVLGE